MKRIIIVLILAMGGFSTQAQVRVPDSDLTVNEGIYYYEGALFNGVGYTVRPNGQLHWEFTFKDGNVDGLSRGWYENGQLIFEFTYKDGVKL